MHTRRSTQREHDEASVASTLLAMHRIMKKRRARHTLTPPHPCPYCECPECLAVKRLLRMQSDVWLPEIE